MQDANSTAFTTGTKLTIEDSDKFDQPLVYRSIVGGLQYLTETRPNIAFLVNKLSQFLKAPTELYWQAYKKVLRYIKGTMNFGLMFQASVILHLECFADTDWASSLQDRRSTSGNCLFLVSNFIQWGF